MKISEISKEMGVPSKDLIAFVNEKGIECKAATKNLSDEETEMVRKAFATKNDKADAKKDNKSNEEVKPKEGKVTNEAPKAKEEASSNATQKEEVKKAPKFNFKINPQFVSNQNQPQKRPAQQGQQQRNNGSLNSNQQRSVNPGATKLIRPTTPPSQTPSVNFEPEHVKVVVPLPKNMEEIKQTIREEINYKGVSVIIPRRECIQTFRRHAKKQN